MKINYIDTPSAGKHGKRPWINQLFYDSSKNLFIIFAQNSFKLSCNKLRCCTHFRDFNWHLLNSCHDDVNYSNVVNGPCNQFSFVIMSSCFSDAKAYFNTPHQKQDFTQCQTMVPPSIRALFELQSCWVFDVFSLEHNTKLY